MARPRLALLAMGVLLMVAANAQDCNRIDHCATCRNARIGGTTKLQRTSCAVKYRVSSDYEACQCAPGYYRDSTSDECTECGTGYWCAGADAQLTRTACPVGMTTLVTVASREEQCVTVEGHGFDTATGNATLCERGFFNSGKNRNPCRACGSGLTTEAEGTTSFGGCVAPAGSYFDKNAAKPCPKGTFTSSLNRNNSCSSCDSGLTTADTGAASSSNCTLAKAGYRLNDSGGASKCSFNTYRVNDAAEDTCTACGENMVTLREGASSPAACVAPPGFEYDSTTDSATECPLGTYKRGSNKRRCVSCGVNFRTLMPGRFSFSDCFIPPGYGTKKFGLGYEVYQCPHGFYGAASNTFGVKNLPCMPCAAGMNTSDAGSTSPADCLTLPGWGYDSMAQTAVLCARGTWSAGLGKSPCTPCGLGYTTLETGSTDASACVIAPGWGFTSADRPPEPCPRGTYGPGNASDATCQQCPGYSTTTVASHAESAADCNVCVAGFGKAGSGDCAACSPNHYSPGDVAECSACPEPSQAPAQSESSDDCLPPWTTLGANVDAIPLLDADYVNSGDSATAAACQSACASEPGCMLYSFNRTAADRNLPGSCVMGMAGGAAKVAFKSNTGVYTVWGFKEGALIGADHETLTGDIGQCTRVCDLGGCSGFIVPAAGGSCTLFSATLDSDISECQIKARGANMNAWSS